jgi:hypothetical protein
MKRLYASQAAPAPLSVPGRRQAPGIGPGFIRTGFLTTGQGLLEHERGGGLATTSSSPRSPASRWPGSCRRETSPDPAPCFQHPR